MKKLVLTTLTLLYLCTIGWSATFISETTGNWNNDATWQGSGVPGVNDNVIILSGHIVTLNGTAYTHSGNIIINQGGELISKAGNSSAGLVFNGQSFHVFGTLTLPFPDKDLEIKGSGLFWGHPSSNIFISDDLIASQQAEVVLEGVCIEVDDDFHIKGSEATICGGGGVSIGTSTSSNTLNLENGATLGQLCTDTGVFRGPNGNCTTLVGAGTGNNELIAVQDSVSTGVNVARTIDVLHLGTADSDSDGDPIQLISVGDNFEDNETTFQGGIAQYNDNGTPLDFSDDFVDYTPPIDFLGVDTFIYIITDGNGSYRSAYGIVNVLAPLPVELAEFYAYEEACDVHIEWTTLSELNNDYFEVEKSTNGKDFKVIARQNGAGSTNAAHFYAFIDDTPAPQNYYRLKQVDFDGTVTYSSVAYMRSICIEDDKNVGILNLYPNPAITSKVDVEFNAFAVEQTYVTLYDAFGTMVDRFPFEIRSGLNNVEINISNLEAGTYFVMIDDRVSRFVKVRS